MMTAMARPAGELNNCLVLFQYILGMNVHYCNGEESR
jgi:hypothetical protein